MKCDPCADLAQLKDWLAKLVRKEGLPLDNAILLEDGSYMKLENGWYVLMENPNA